MNVIITGATKGIGKATAAFFLQQGANIAICSRHQKDLEATRATWRQQYPDAEILVRQVDMAVRTQIDDFARMIQDRWEQVDILINNAGIFRYGLMREEPIDQLTELLQINLLGVHYMTRATLPFIRQPQGQIINICSIASKKAIKNSGSYSVSKHALLGYTNNLREELRPLQIKVTAVLPSATWSSSWTGADLPTERLMATEEVGRAIWEICQFDATTVVEEVVLRPPLGDI
ncbi:MAG: SDR family oxidoreductase [Bacteroidota bacterium]